MAATKPPHKRRRLTGSATPPPTTMQPPGKVLTASSNTNVTAKPANGIPVCTSCHRALNALQGNLLHCARWVPYLSQPRKENLNAFYSCSSTTCAICSRVCTACAPSLPPTPHLSWSPSPSPSPHASPRRSALSLHSVNTNLITTPSGSSWPHVTSNNTVAGKRRKLADNDNDSDGVDRPYERATGHHSSSDLDLFGCGPGCGRTLCRNCCFENIQK